MKLRQIFLMLRSCGYVSTLAVVATSALLNPAVARADPQHSVKQHGEILVQPDASLQDGRWIVRIAILNRDKSDAAFTLESINISTVSGKPVALLSAEQLRREVLNAALAQRHTSIHFTDHQPNNYAMNENAAIRDSSGAIVSGNYGGATVGANSFENSADFKSLPPDIAAKANAQITAIEAGLLKSEVIAPGKTIAGQTVTDKLRFSGEEPRTLKMIITFNQEQYEFMLDVPAEQK